MQQCVRFVTTDTNAMFIFWVVYLQRTYFSFQYVRSVFIFENENTASIFCQKWTMRTYFYAFDWQVASSMNTYIRTKIRLLVQRSFASFFFILGGFRTTTPVQTLL